ncbi:hypothetical protein MASR2M18_11840 [Ignavibacteria bacterium]
MLRCAGYDGEQYYDKQARDEIHLGNKSITKQFYKNTKRNAGNNENANFLLLQPLFADLARNKRLFKEKITHFTEFD